MDTQTHESGPSVMNGYYRFPSRRFICCSTKPLHCTQQHADPIRASDVAIAVRSAIPRPGKSTAALCRVLFEIGTALCANHVRAACEAEDGILRWEATIRSERVGRSMSVRAAGHVDCRAARGAYDAYDAGNGSL